MWPFIGDYTRIEGTMKTISLIFCLSIVFGTMANTKANNDMEKLVNYVRMNKAHKKYYQTQRTRQFISWEKNQIPENFRIPVELQSYRGTNSTRYYTIYNPSYNTGVGYVPTNLTQYYEEEAWSAFKKYGKDAPSLSIVLAQQFTESAFNQFAVGDNNMSFGLPQLYRKTAEYLYKTDKETWENIFYFDKYGKHHFRNVRAMVKFPFIFLPKVKKYSFAEKFQGIRRYNGSGESAVLYAEKVIKRSLYYEDLFAKYNSIPLDTTGFKENLFGLINLSLLAKGEPEIEENTLNYIFENMLSDFYSGYVNKTYFNKFCAGVFEGDPLVLEKTNNHKIPIDGKDYYLIVEDGYTLYSYFKEPNQLLKSINHPKNSRYYIYYNEGKKKVKLSSLSKVGKKQVFTNVRPGDRLFIPPGTVIRKPNTDFAVMIQ